MAVEDDDCLDLLQGEDESAINSRPGRSCPKRYPRPAKRLSPNGKQRTIWKRFTPRSATTSRLIRSTDRLPISFKPTSEGVDKITKKRCVGEGQRAVAVSWDATHQLLEHELKHKVPSAVSDNGASPRKRKLQSADSDESPAIFSANEAGAKKRKLESAGSGPEVPEVGKDEEPGAGSKDAQGSPRDQNNEGLVGDSSSPHANIDPRLRSMGVDELDDATCDVTNATVPIQGDLPEDSRVLYNIPGRESVEQHEEASQEEDEFFALDMESTLRPSVGSDPPDSQESVYPEPPAPHWPVEPLLEYADTEYLDDADPQLEWVVTRPSNEDDSEKNEEFLQGFLRRAEATKAVKIAEQSTMEKKRDSRAIKSALKESRGALSGLDKNSPLRSARQFQRRDAASSPLAAHSAVIFDDMDDLASVEGTVSRFERRRPLRQVSTHQSHYSEEYAITHLDAKSLAMHTDSNTDRNRGVLARFTLKEMKRDGRDHWRREGEPAPGKKSVQWREQLAEYSERPESLPERGNPMRPVRRKRRRNEDEDNDGGDDAVPSTPQSSLKRTKKWHELPDFLQGMTRASARLAEGAQAAFSESTGAQAPGSSPVVHQTNETAQAAVANEASAATDLEVAIANTLSSPSTPRLASGLTSMSTTRSRPRSSRTRSMLPRTTGYKRSPPGPIR